MINASLSATVGKLEQPSTLRPFHRELIILAKIACRASKNNMIDIVTGSVLCAAKWDSVLKMVDVLATTFFKFTKAVVAFVFLSLQLSLDLLSGKRARNSFLECASIDFMHAMLFEMSCTIQPRFFEMRLIVFFSIFVDAVPISFDIPSVVFRALLVVSLGFIVIACFTQRMQPIFCVFVTRKEITSCRKCIRTLVAVFHPFRNWHLAPLATQKVMSFLTCLAPCRKTVFSCSVFIEVFIVCCKVLFAAVAILVEDTVLGYNGIHVRTSNSFITAPDMSSIAGQNHVNLTLPLYHKPASEARLSHFFAPQFASLGGELI